MKKIKKEIILKMQPYLFEKKKKEIRLKFRKFKYKIFTLIFFFFIK